MISYAIISKTLIERGKYRSLLLEIIISVPDFMYS